MEIYKQYAYKIIWSEKDQEYVGLCVEHPGLSHLDTTVKKALNGIMALVRDVVKIMVDNGEDVPEPLSKKHYSGNIPFRTTPEIHRQIAIEAAERHVSINRYLNSKFSHY